MRNKEKRLFVFSSAIFQIILLMSIGFAVSFILDQGNIVSGQEPGSFEPPLPPETMKVELKGSTGQAASQLGTQTQTYRIIDGLQVKIPPSAIDGYSKTVSGTLTKFTPGTEGTAQAIVDGKIVNLNANGAKVLQSKLASGGFLHESYSYKVPVLGIETVGTVAHLAQGLVWSVVVVGAIQLFGGLFGADAKLTNALSIAAVGGIMSGKLALGIVTEGIPGLTGATGVPFGLTPGAFSTGVGVIVAVAIFVLTYKDESKKLVRFQCLPFEPPLGGQKCEDCNKDPFRPCSEYRCKSLGQACELLNVGTLEEACTWVNPKDVNSPIIQTWSDVLKPSNLKYTPDSAIRPPNRGVKVVGAGAEGCLQAFTPLEFGITTNEPAQCKVDYNHTNGFDEMEFYFGESNYYRYNHTQRLKLPGPDNTELGEGDLAPELKNDGFFSLFVRCRDANGNANVDEFVFNFCVDPSPDTTPPRVVGTNIESEGFVRNNADNVPIEVYVNEPADCRWSRTSKDYDSMENSMDDCATETFQINADLNYVCTGNLTGIKNQEDNEFFFRCKDQPSKPENERNVMVQSFPLILKGSQELNILNVAPNGTIFGSTDTVTVDLSVRTDDGAEEGKAICFLSSTNEVDSFVRMGETNSFEHKQSLDLVSGNYPYFFRCVDKGGNAVEGDTSFNVVIDKQAPRVTRAYKAEGLKVVTDEDAECVYSLNSCNYEFDEGLKMIYSNPSLKMQHFAEWRTNSVYYIKCEDLYGNRPAPNECGIVVKSIEISDS